MNPRTSLLTLLLATSTSLGLAGVSQAQIDQKLQGTWVGTSDDNRGERVTIDASTMSLGGESLPIRNGGPGVLIIGDPSDGWRLNYQFRGEELLVTEEGFTSTWSRVGGPSPQPEPPVVEESGEEEPVAGPHPFVGTWQLDRVTLVLQSSDGRSYQGELRVGSHRFPVTATLRDGRLEGSLDREGRPSPLSAWSDSPSTLSVRNGGKTLELRAANRSRPEPRRAVDDNAATISFKQHTLTDPMLGGIQSHTLYVPSGFEIHGGVLWSPTETITNQLSMTVQDRTGTAFTTDRCRHFFYADPESLRMTGKRMGQQLSAGTTVLGPPQKIGDAVEFAILPALRPNARNIRIVDAKIDQEMLRFMRENGVRPVASSRESRSWDSCEAVLVTYTENGQEFEEEFSYMVSGLHNTFPMLNAQTHNGTWSIMSTRSVRAPKGQLRSRRSELAVISSSLRPTPRWWTAQSKVVAEIMAARQRRHAITMDAIRARGQQIAKTNDDISDIQMKIYRTKVDSEDRLQRQAVDATWEVERYQSPHNGTLEISNQFDRVFENANGGLIVTSDPSYQPGLDSSVNGVSWNELPRARR